MSSQTPNLNLTLPVGTEKVSRQIINENMTKIDQYCGAINQSTYRKIPFTLALADWSQSGGQWVVNFDTIYVTDTSDDNVKFSDSIVSYEKAHIFWEKKSGGGGIKFTTATKPTGAITGVITAFDNDDGKVPTLLEDTVTPIANGGTGQSTLNGAKQALGITDLADHMGKCVPIHNFAATELTTISSQGTNWQATADCWVTGTLRASNGGGARVLINDVPVAINNMTEDVGLCVPARKGDTIKTRSGYGVYGLTIYPCR